MNYFKNLASESAYRSVPVFVYVNLTAPGEPALFATSSFLACASFSGVNYGSILCLSDSRTGGGIKNICVQNNMAYVQSITATETSISLT